jgi:curved DNA-binding protein CbpA
MSYYTILGASRDSTPVEVRDKYFKKARETHPDRSRGSNDCEEFTTIKKAFDTLSDPAKREAYDNALSATSAHGDTKFTGNIPFWDEINLHQMKRDGDVFLFDCKCGDYFEISEDELRSSENQILRVLACGGCSLKIAVRF